MYKRIKEMPLTVLLAWVFIVTLFSALFLAVPMAAVVVGVVAGFMFSVKRLVDYYVSGE
jgi:hypothetical protein